MILKILEILINFQNRKIPKNVLNPTKVIQNPTNDRNRKISFLRKILKIVLSDFRFLDLCYKKLVLKKSNASDKCGFFRINRESVVPYTVKDTIKYVPLFYFEGETDHLKLKSDKVDGWDLAYLKFCCKVQGIRNELFAADTCRVVALDEIKGHFPSGKNENILY